MLLRIITNALTPTTLDIVNGQAVTAYRLLKPGFSLGNESWEHQFSGQRGTQGAKPAPGVPQNRTVNLPIRVYGTTKDDLALQESTLRTAVDELRRFGGRILFQSNNQSKRQWLRVLVAGCSDTDWSRAETKNIAELAVAAICAPYAEGDPMDYTDDYSADNINGTNAYFTADLGALTDLTVDTVNKVLKGAASLATEKRIVFTGYGYTYGDQQVTIKATPGATITSFKAGVVLKRVDANNYIEAYVDDNGVNSRLRIDVIVAGVRTNRATTNLAARVINATAFWLRGRIEGNAIFAQYHTTKPTMHGAASLNANNTYTLAAGAEQNALGSTIQGRAGLSFIPQTNAATIDDLEIWPFTYRAIATPALVVPSGVIPGDAPALCCLWTGYQNASNLNWLLFSWWQAQTQNANTPLGIFQAESQTLSGFAAVGGNAQLDSAVTASGTIIRTVNLAECVPDDYSGEVEVEVWARFKLPSTVVAPTFIASAVPVASNSQTVLSTPEFGTVGKVVWGQSSDFTIARLGTLRLTVDPAGSFYQFNVQFTRGGGSTGLVLVDAIAVLPTRARAAGPTAKPLGASYPAFLPGDANVDHSTKVVRFDGSGAQIDVVNGGTGPSHGLGGALLELPKGAIDFAILAENSVPDDTTNTFGGTNLSPTVHLSITPRYRMLRAA